MAQWDTVGEYDVAVGTHRAFVSPKVDLVVEGVALKQGEMIRIEESYKYSRTQIEELWRSANVTQAMTWTNHAGDYGTALRLHFHFKYD